MRSTECCCIFSKICSRNAFLMRVDLVPSVYRSGVRRAGGSTDESARGRGRRVPYAHLPVHACPGAHLTLAFIGSAARDGALRLVCIRCISPLAAGQSPYPGSPVFPFKSLPDSTTGIGGVESGALRMPNRRCFNTGRFNSTCWLWDCSANEAWQMTGLPARSC